VKFDRACPGSRFSIWLHFSKVLGARLALFGMTGTWPVQAATINPARCSNQ
jgi:hypothetical protein